MSKRTGRKPKRERTSRRRTRRHSSTSESSSEDVPPPPPPPPKTAKTRARSKVDEAEKKVALTIKLPKPESNDCSEDNAGMWKVECSNGSDGDIQKLKISLRRSPKDILREQAAEAKSAAERKAAEEAAGSSKNSDALDGSVTNYLEQFSSTVAVEEPPQNTAVSTEQVQVEITPKEPPCSQDSLSQIDNDQQMDSSEISSEPNIPKGESIVENVLTDNNKFIDKVSNEIVVENLEVYKDTIEPTIVEVESVNSSEQDSTIVHAPIEECKISEPALRNNSESIEEVVSSDVVEVISSGVTDSVSSDVDIPIALSEQVQDVIPELIENVVNEPITFNKVLEEESLSTVETIKTTIDTKDESSKIDIINDSEQMEDVVQLAVESPDFVEDEDPKPTDEDSHKHVEEDETKSVPESYPKLSSDTPSSKQVDVVEEFKLEETQIQYETPKLLSSHPKRKWGSCKTRTPISISPFTLGIIIESNGDSIDDNGEYRSEEGEIQRTDSDEEQEVEEAMDTNDTMLIDHEAVDYEAPEEEDKPDIDIDDSKSDKSTAAKINDVEPKNKSSSVKRLKTTSVIRITNLVRPFTVGQLRDLLQRTGKIVPNGFWIDTIKSQCIVEYENEDQAVETVYALNESQWPSTNPKFLRVVFTDKEELNKALNGTHPDKLGKQKESKVENLRTQVENQIILREWDRGKLEDMNGEKEEKPLKRKISDDPHTLKDKKAKKDEKDLQDKRRKSKSKTPERIPTKSLDELFRKTKTTPTLYWSPLSTEQIAEREDQRRKHLAEMERSQKTDRRRRDINHYPRRR